MSAGVETNGLILAGTHERVFAVELESGDVTAFGETVARIDRVAGPKPAVFVHMTNGQVSVCRGEGATMLIERKAS